MHPRTDDKLRPPAASSEADEPARRGIGESSEGQRRAAEPASLALVLRLEGGDAGARTNGKAEFTEISAPREGAVSLVRGTLGGSTLYSRSRAVAELSRRSAGLALRVTQFGVAAGVCVNAVAAQGTVVLSAGDRVCFSRSGEVKASTYVVEQGSEDV